MEKPIQKIIGLMEVFIFSKMLKLFKSDQTILEHDPMQKLCKLKQLMAFKHKVSGNQLITLKIKIMLKRYLKIKKG